jgi:hypothetical protein
MPNSENVDTAHMFKVHVNRWRTSERRGSDDSESALEFFTNCVRRRGTIPSPPKFQFADMLGGKSADLDR